MAGSWNRVELGGNVGKDPEVRSFASGGKVATFSLATTERWKDRTSGEAKEKVSWHRIIAKNEKTVEFVEKYIQKGMSLRVVGKIAYREWEQDGQKRNVTEIEVDPIGGITFLDKRDDTQPARLAQIAPQRQPADLDDEIPW